jgi:hypothetical protein
MRFCTVDLTLTSNEINERLLELII